MEFTSEQFSSQRSFNSLTASRASSSTIDLTPPTKIKKLARPHSDRNQNARVNSWTHVEEVFLVGAIMSRWFLRGSLSPNRKENKGDNCWEEIRQNYESSWDEYCTRSGVTRPLHRTSSALTRHFKIMKMNLEKGQSLRDFYLEWELRYNSTDFNSVFKKYEDIFAINTVDDSEISWCFQTDDSQSVRTETFYEEMMPQEQENLKRDFEQTYYNTVQGSDGVQMAKQLKMEQALFKRNANLAAAEAEKASFSQIFCQDFGIIAEERREDKICDEYLDSMCVMEEDATDQLRAPYTAPAYSSPRGNVFDLFGLARPEKSFNK